MLKAFSSPFYLFKKIFVDIMLCFTENNFGVFEGECLAGLIEGEEVVLSHFKSGVMLWSLTRKSRKKIYYRLFSAPAEGIIHLAAEVANDLGADGGLLPGLAKRSFVLTLVALNVPLRKTAIAALACP